MSVVSLKPNFENMKAMLAHIADDDAAIGFVGCVVHSDGTMQPIHFGATREQHSFAAALWLNLSVTPNDK
jgi:hypothetical protein